VKAAQKQGESKRLITNKCTKRQRAEAMALCVSSLVSTLPVPLKGKLEQLKDLFDGGASIYTAVNDDTSDNDDSDEDSDGSNADGDGIGERVGFGANKLFGMIKITI
jgi:hypothetical protein